MLWRSVPSIRVIPEQIPAPPHTHTSKYAKILYDLVLAFQVLSKVQLTNNLLVITRNFTHNQLNIEWNSIKLNIDQIKGVGNYFRMKKCMLCLYQICMKFRVSNFGENSISSYEVGVRTRPKFVPIFQICSYLKFQAMSVLKIFKKCVKWIYYTQEINKSHFLKI